jgi:hypothetical protein
MRSCSSGTGITRRRGSLIAAHSRPTNRFAVQRQQAHDQCVRCLSRIFTGTWKLGPWITIGLATIHRIIGRVRELPQTPSIRPGLHSSHQPRPEFPQCVHPALAADESTRSLSART